jgi:hypothetical protein
MSSSGSSEAPADARPRHPARLTPLVFDALLTTYGAKAEAIHHAIVNGAADGQLEPVRSTAPSCSTSTSCSNSSTSLQPAIRSPSLANATSSRRAIYDALTEAIACLGHRCHDYWHGNADLDAIATTNNQLRGLMRLLRVIEIDATAPDRGGGA